MTSNAQRLMSVLTLVLLAGGCASTRDASTPKTQTTATAVPARSSDRGSGTVAAKTTVASEPTKRATSAAPIAGSATSPASSKRVAAADNAPKYTAIIDGKEVPCPDIPMGD